MTTMTKEQKQAFFNQYGVMPITDDDIPESSKIVLTAEQLNEIEQNVVRSNAKNYLKETDWYVTRKAETGIDIPAEVLEKRAQARLNAN